MTAEDTSARRKAFDTGRALTAQARCSGDGETVPGEGQLDDGQGRANPLLVQARDTVEARLPIAGLRGRRLPDVELTTSDSMCLPLRAHISALVVFYFVAGESDAAWVDGRLTPDASQHLGYASCLDAFQKMGVRVFGVSCQPAEILKRIVRSLEITHIVFSDPDLVLAQALGMPTVRDGDTRRYRRTALVVHGGLIHKALGPLSDSEAAGNARQVLAWMHAAAV
jgi:peroxiredoxin